MNARPIKFRYLIIFDLGEGKFEKKWHYWTLEEIERSETLLSHRYAVVINKGQWTGLKDKNGIEIFEGDIVKKHYECASISRDYKGAETVDDKWKIEEEIHSVEWRSYDDGEYVSNIQCWMIGSNSLSDKIDYPSEWKTSYWSIRNNYLEVIGNIYENPKLLK